MAVTFFSQKRKSPKKLLRDRVAIQESGLCFARPGEYVINTPISRRLEHASCHSTAPDRPIVQTRHEPRHRRRTTSTTPIQPHRPPIAANNSRSLTSAPPVDHSRHGNNHLPVLSLKARATKSMQSGLLACRERCCDLRHAQVVGIWVFDGIFPRPSEAKARFLYGYPIPKQFLW